MQATRFHAILGWFMDPSECNIAVLTLEFVAKQVVKCTNSLSWAHFYYGGIAKIYIYKAILLHYNIFTLGLFCSIEKSKWYYDFLLQRKWVEQDKKVVT